MGQKLFAINGRFYDVAIKLGSLTRTANITDGKNAGRSQGGIMIRDIIGTFISYSIEIETKNLNASEYDELVITLRQPVNQVLLSIVDGQEMLTFYAYVTKVEDSLQDIWRGVNRWGGLKLTFTPMEPHISP